MSKDTRNYYEQELGQIDFNGEHPAKIILIGSDGRTTRTLDINKESAVALIHKLTSFLIAHRAGRSPQSPLRAETAERAAGTDALGRTRYHRTAHRETREHKQRSPTGAINERKERP
jgi:hypothetical protein